MCFVVPLLVFPCVVFRFSDKSFAEVELLEFLYDHRCCGILDTWKYLKNLHVVITKDHLSLLLILLNTFSLIFR